MDMHEVHVAATAADTTATAQQPSAELTATAPFAEDPTVHPNPQSPPSSTVSGTFSKTTSVAEAKRVTATLSTAADSLEPVLVGKVVSAELSEARSTRQASDLNAVQNDTGAPRRVHSGEQKECFPPATSASFSSSSSSNNDSSNGDANFDHIELIFDFGRYVGQVDPLTGLRDGHGCQHYNSGNVYTGEWRNGAADGFGEKCYKNGDVYRGNWRQGKRSGRGAYLFAQGDFYDGMYLEDNPEGYGIYTTLKGDRYAGRWKAGHKHGKGRETLVNGQVFVGNWRNGKKQGRGKLYLPGTERYIYGIWNNDKFFRELTATEMGVEGEEDIVDEFGVPRDSFAPPVAPPWKKPPPSGGGITDHILMGVTALEDRMESLGRALERVINDDDGDKNMQAPPTVAAGTADSTAGSVASSEECTGLPLDGFIVNNPHKGDEE
ncbi:hypothetical protein LBRM_20_4820 [Leishmania braziliensis MHOM/BR/75/M2904]|uniref:Uncharacterized protein n=1 Tax=Leishmania braziliensis TaxID=5660 RepID=E9AIB5_LEIBR|nr:hypothetical protein LBRM_20_4820 [Leishmania braziliensis MHOM/BR/75/M2904]KAI5686734.1 MORN repeat [Leishmania braziliensis]CAJ2471935.1 unnamed protein product [Leishmania braziliensis]CAJ2472452.1 unnamed protein product [Leishmania braziliensis]CBZ14559.1 hypothetical protein LBRM_20_4820 [Leishmania braziliensis MHOM/BR/75/M2904]